MFLTCGSNCYVLAPRDRPRPGWTNTGPGPWTRPGPTLLMTDVSWLFLVMFDIIHTVICKLPVYTVESVSYDACYIVSDNIFIMYWYQRWYIIPGHVVAIISSAWYHIRLIWYITWGHIISYHIISYHIISYHIISHNITSYHISLLLLSLLKYHIITIITSLISHQLYMYIAQHVHHI